MNEQQALARARELVEQLESSVSLSDYTLGHILALVLGTTKAELIKRFKPEKPDQPK